MSFSDGERHTRRRRLVAKAFTRRRVEELSALIADNANRLLDAMAAGGEAELISGFTTPLPLNVMTTFLGVPFADQGAFQRWLDLMVSVDPADVADIPVGVTAMIEYIAALIAEKRAQLGDDLISALIQLSDEDGGLGGSEVLAMVFELMTGAYETTKNLLSNGILALIEHPGQLAALRADPGLTGPAVEEMLRFESPTTSTLWRFPREDVVIGGRRIPAGDPVLPLLGAANRDPRVFADPNRFDLFRPNLKHVAFGSGPHTCPGAAIPRLEARIALPLLLARLGDLRLAVDRGQVRYRRTFMARALNAVPIAFRAATQDIAGTPAASREAAKSAAAVSSPKW
ncbi:cytochrome P450 [Kitasatospora sp. NBC_01266]|uniref:cytochrome P450 n=1 Tax=Kitasatospora sp. NBC_01266 TaxID=2903572 RepID=UPI002E33D875|nr:cytochrome P450 [Kitasatospora sp. NBC_01266]